MNQETPRSEELENRFRGMVDIVYLSYVVWFYVASLLIPLFGIVMGIILIYGSVHSQAKRVGRVCLILGIINIIVITVILIILAIALAPIIPAISGILLVAGIIGIIFIIVAVILIVLALGTSFAGIREHR